MLLREATSETYGPWVSSLLYCISFYYRISFTILQSLLSIYTTKIPKIFTLLSLLDLTLRVTVKELTTPLSRWLQGS